MTTDPDRLRAACHEAPHAAVGFALGWRIRLVVVHRGARLLGFVEHHPRTDLSALELAVDDITILAAGEIGELLVPHSGYIEPVDDDTSGSRRRRPSRGLRSGRPRSRPARRTGSGAVLW